MILSVQDGVLCSDQSVCSRHVVRRVTSSDVLIPLVLVCVLAGFRLARFGGSKGYSLIMDPKGGESGLLIVISDGNQSFQDRFVVIRGSNLLLLVAVMIP